MMTTAGAKISPFDAAKETVQANVSVLADNRDGCTEAIMLAHGFRVELLADLCIAGLAIATVERMVAGRRTVEVVRLKITDAGRQALTGKGAQ